MMTTLLQWILVSFIQCAQNMQYIDEKIMAINLTSAEVYSATKLPINKNRVYDGIFTKREDESVTTYTTKSKYHDNRKLLHRLEYCIINDSNLLETQIGNKWTKINETDNKGIVGNTETYRSSVVFNDKQKKLLLDISVSVFIVLQSCACISILSAIYGQEQDKRMRRRH